MTQIAIIGPGAVGSTIAKDLQEKYNNVHLLGRSNKQLNYHSYETPDQTSTLQVTAINDFSKVVDILIIAVKIPQLQNVLSQINHLIGSHTTIILAQNGYGQLGHIKHPNVYQTVVYISGQKQENHITHFQDHTLIMDNNSRTQQLFEIAQNTKLSIELTDQIEEKIWYKLLVNSGINTITALTQQPVKVMEKPNMKQLCNQLLNEGISIAKAEGIVLEPSTVSDIMDIYESYPPEMGTSMYYDMLAQRPTEIDGIQGFLYQCARKHQLHTPILDTVYTLLLAQQPEE
ncbi:oxidoreductase [Staphylococcus sp. HKU1]|uniref:oxidoreductase n=1 Tax=Staphylococcus sp. HKU1 TaxID=3068989 RepID=UPI003AB0AC7E